MEFSVKMQPAMMMGIVWIVVGAVLLGIAVALFVLTRLFAKARPVKKERPPEPKKPTDYFYIRREAIHSIDKISLDLKKNKIDVRESYQRLSMTMRTFVSDMTGREVTNLTLSEIKEMGFGSLSQVITGYYEPEFALKTTADFESSAEVARRMIQTWS